MKTTAGLLLLAVLIGMLAGCVTTPTRSFPLDEARQDPPPTSGVLNLGDLVVVTFSGTDAVIAPHEERIKDDGTITLPYIGAITAQGKSPGELQREIRNKYIEGKIYQPNLTVTVRGQERSFFVAGEVRLPNRYVWTEGMTVLKAISSAGDFTDFAWKTRVTITRLDGRKFKVDCKKAMENPDLDLRVYPGDRINVPKSPF